MALLDFYLKCDTSRRIKCNNADTYTYFWPYFFARAVRGARPLCRWAARRGAAVNAALQLQMKGGSGNSGCCYMTAARSIPAMSTLISLPLTLSLGVSKTIPSNCAAKENWDLIEELAGLVIRHLQSHRSPYKPYFEFLHDVNNLDEDTEVTQNTSVTARLSERLDALYGGNAMHVNGVPNAPFINKTTLRTLPQRVQWARVQVLRRRLEQSLPYFAAKSAAWGLSMVLSRAVVDDQGGLTLLPLIDFCAHSFNPNAFVVVRTSTQEHRDCGLKWHDDTVPCAHLLSSREIKVGETITRLFDSRAIHSLEDAEYWQMRWGFIPASPPGTKSY